MPEIPGLTGLRAIAALWVLAFHLSPQVRLFFGDAGFFDEFIRAGFYGVDLFFVLSGFVIAYNYFDLLATCSWKNYRRFLGARLARIYPLHLAMLISTLIAITVATQFFYIDISDTAFRFSDFWAHVFLVSAWRFPAHLSWNHFAWSVSAEFLAYLLAPVFVGVIVFLRRPVWLTLFAALLCVICPLLDFMTPYAATGYAIPRVLCGFGLGMLGYIFYQKNPKIIKNQYFICAVLTMIGGVIYGECLTDYKIRFLVLPLFALLIIAVTGKNTISHFLSHKILLYGGRISYAVYITQFVVLMPIRKLLPPEHLFYMNPLVKIGYLCGEIALVLIVSIAAYHLVEQPARALLRKKLG